MKIPLFTPSVTIDYTMRIAPQRVFCPFLSTFMTIVFLSCAKMLAQVRGATPSVGV